ncbi:Gfo/Idh/MocA family protein [Curtobacterium sp. USHLN213]|uniref:Gfo/Idh/MocA family protein n=1 Tax=Curtobacterium sp. USHLN213 TaxID=3081255 RepID=UPI003016FA61
MIRVGLLGAGMIATTATGYLPGLSLLANRCEVVAIASRTRASAERVAASYGIVRVHDDLESMLRDDQLDVIVNCTPIGVHAETSLAIVRAGVHLVSEKPLASTAVDAREILAAAQTSGSRIVVAPSRMLEPSRLRAQRLVESGSIGQVLSARFRVSHAGPAGMPWPADPRPAYAADAGPLNDLAPYAVEQVLGLIGPIRKVFAMSATSRPRFPAYGNGPFGGVEVAVDSDDTVSLVLEAGDRAIVTVESSFGPVASRAPAGEIFGTDGTIALYTRYGNERGPLVETHHRGSAGWVDPTTLTDLDAHERMRELGRASLVAHLLDALEYDEPLVADGSTAQQIVAVLEAAHRSAVTGRSEHPRV